MKPEYFLPSGGSIPHGQVSTAIITSQRCQREKNRGHFRSEEIRRWFPIMSNCYGSFSEKWDGVGKNMDVRVRQSLGENNLWKIFNISEPQLPHFEMEMIVSWCFHLQIVVGVKWGNWWKTAAHVCKTVMSCPDVSCLLFMFETWSLIVECNVLSWMNSRY